MARTKTNAASEGEQNYRSVDLLGRVYEYLHTRFARAALAEHLSIALRPKTSLPSHA